MPGMKLSQMLTWILLSFLEFKGIFGWKLFRNYYTFNVAEAVIFIY